MSPSGLILKVIFKIRFRSLYHRLTGSFFTTITPLIISPPFLVVLIVSGCASFFEFLFPVNVICPKPLFQTLIFLFLVPCNSLVSLLAPSVRTMKGTMPAAQPKARSCHFGHWAKHQHTVCVVQWNDSTRH